MTKKAADNHLLTAFFYKLLFVPRPASEADLSAVVLDSKSDTIIGFDFSV